MSANPLRRGATETQCGLEEGRTGCEISAGTSGVSNTSAPVSCSERANALFSRTRTPEREVKENKLTISGKAAYLDMSAAAEEAAEGALS